MAFAVEDFEDLLRLLSERPDWRERLRTGIFGAEFEELPAAVRELVATQQRTEQRVHELAEAQQRTEQRVNELAEAMRRLTEKIDVAVEALTSRRDDMTSEFGYMYEMFFNTRAPGIFRRWFVRPRPIHFDEIEQLDEAAQSGELSEDDMDQIAALDILLLGRDRASRESVYVAVEVSRTVNPGDVDRARDRAAILRRAGVPARAAVGGRRITHEAQTIADDDDVIVALLAAQPA
jgi:hypothetical protein